MKTITVVPINRLSQAKSRLAPVLGAAERGTLVLSMARRVLDAIRDSGAVDQIAVVSPDDDLLCWAATHDAIPIRQHAGDLNAALELGRDHAIHAGADALLVLHADLPRLTASDVTRFVAHAASAPRVAVIAPARSGTGTNGLLLRPPSLLPFAFGPESLSRHLAFAREAGVCPLLFESPGIACDVDTPADLAALVESGLWRPSHGDLLAAPFGRGGGCHE